MKTKTIIFSALVILMGMGTAWAAGATNEISSLLQKGLFEEEANHNLDAAIAAYQAVVTQTEKDRQFAATAVFRLGECYRKLGKTNEASVQYQRILREFPDQTELVKLSQPYAAATTNAEPVNLAAAQQRAETMLEKGELERIKAMIKDSPDLINGQNGQPIPLVDAASHNYLTVAKYLLDNKADVNVKRDGVTAINVATEYGRKEMVELLADRGADVNGIASSYSAQGAPLHLAALKGYKAVAEVLLAHKADVNIKNANGATPLHLVAANGFLSFAELLLAKGANVNAQADSGETPLHYAAGADNRSIMELLIAHQADVNARARNGATPLIAAAEASRLAAARLLLTDHADVNARTTGNSDGWMPLHFAVASRQLELVKLLLENKAEVNAPVSQFNGMMPGIPGFPSLAPPPGSFSGRLTGRVGSPGYIYANVAPLAMAVIIGQREIAEALLDHQAAPNAVDKDSDTPLSLAVKLNRYELAELLLARGAVADVKNDDQVSPLNIAVANNQPEMVKLLLAHKPALEATDNEFYTPLQRAIQLGAVEVMGLLLDAGANPDIGYEREGGESPLQWAVRRANKEMVAQLLAHHANPNFQDRFGNTPLSQVRVSLANHPDTRIAFIYTEITDMLVKAGANDNLQRLTGISVSRRGAPQEAVVFYKGTNSYNRPTLFELLAQYYCPPNWRPRDMGLPAQGGFPGAFPLSSVPGLQFPDFGKIKISRLQKDGKTNNLSVDLANALESGDCSKDIPLEWGDIVEIPESVHNVNETWTGLANSVGASLQKCVSRKVDVVVRGETNQVTLSPLHYVLRQSYVFNQNGLNSERMGGASGMGGGGRRGSDATLKTQLSSFWLYDVVHGANVILTSSDLSRVKVRRVNPASPKRDEMIFDLVKPDSGNPLLLRDGDVIELPDKP